MPKSNFGDIRHTDIIFSSTKSIQDRFAKTKWYRTDKQKIRVLEAASKIYAALKILIQDVPPDCLEY